MTSTTYRIVPAPKFAGMKTWDCSRCGRVEVRPVFLSDGGAALPFGSGCAARMLGRPEGDARRVRVEADAADRAEAARVELAAARAAAYAEVAEALAATPDAPHPFEAETRRTFHALGGFDALGPFPAWVARVASTGDLAA